MGNDKIPKFFIKNINAVKPKTDDINCVKKR